MELESYTKIDKNGREITKQHYPVLYGKARKQEKRDEAEARQAEHNKLTLEQKIAKAMPQGKEHYRLVQESKA